MAEKFRNRYRIPSTRLQTWDYGSKGAYFVTICTQGRQYFFGDIINGRMQLSIIGKILEREWIDSPKIRPDMNLTLDAFVVMPNHFHGIIIIGDNIHNRVGYPGGAMNNGLSDNGSMDKTTMVNGAMDKTTMDNGAMDKTTMVNGAMDKTIMDNGAMDKTTMVNGTMDKTTMVNGTMDKTTMDKTTMDNGAMDKPTMVNG